MKINMKNQERTEMKWPARIRIIPTLLVASAALLMTCCGYGLQTSHNELIEKEGVRRIYVKPLINNTFKPGIENVVYNALVRTLLAHHRVKLTSSINDADAILDGAVVEAQFGVSGSTTATALPPLGLSIPSKDGPPAPPKLIQVPGDTQVASIYTASLTCSFSLYRPTPLPPGRKAAIWSGGFSNARPFPASNQLDVPGTTSALINESEFERALSDIATSMMEDLHEQMLAMF
jgi:hypothetical protein